jgi:hypothetical protein
VLEIGAAVIGALIGFLGAYLIYSKQRSDHEQAYRDQQIDTELRVLITRVVLQHDLCAGAKDWLRKLPNWGDALDDKERANSIRSEAAIRMNECYSAWDQGLNGVESPDVRKAMEMPQSETEGALAKAQAPRI